jgi:hypothetical protein
MAAPQAVTDHEVMEHLLNAMGCDTLSPIRLCFKQNGYQVDYLSALMEEDFQDQSKFIFKEGKEKKRLYGAYFTIVKNWVYFLNYKAANATGMPVYPKDSAEWINFIDKHDYKVFEKQYREGRIVPVFYKRPGSNAPIAPRLIATSSFTTTSFTSDFAQKVNYDKNPAPLTHESANYKEDMMGISTSKDENILVHLVENATDYCRS